MPGLLEASQHKLSMADISEAGLGDPKFLAENFRGFHLTCGHGSTEEIRFQLDAAAAKGELRHVPADVPRLSFLAPRFAGQLPLHFLCSNTNVDSTTIKMFIDALPQSAETKDAAGNLPLHILCGNEGADIAVVKVYIDALPQSMHAKNATGKLPAELARKTEATSASGQLGLIADVLFYLTADEVKEAETADDFAAAVAKKKSVVADSEGAIKRIRDDSIREQVTELQKQCFEHLLEKGEGGENEAFVKLREISLRQAVVLGDLIGECMAWYHTADAER